MWIPKTLVYSPLLYVLSIVFSRHPERAVSYFDYVKTGQIERVINLKTIEFANNYLLN